MQDTDTAELNAQIAKLAQAWHSADAPVKIVDQYSGYDPQSDNGDNWHHNSAGESKMADKWYSALRPDLN